MIKNGIKTSASFLFLIRDSFDNSLLWLIQLILDECPRIWNLFWNWIKTRSNKLVFNYYLLKLSLFISTTTPRRIREYQRRHSPKYFDCAIC